MWRPTSTRVAWRQSIDARGFDNAQSRPSSAQSGISAQSRPSSAQSMRSASRVRAAGAVKSNVKRSTRDLATSPIKGPSPRPSPLQARYLSCDVSTSPGRPAYHEPASPYLRNSPSVKSSPVFGSMLRASQMEAKSARQSIVSPGSPTGKLLRTRKQNEALQAELHRLQDAFEDIDDRNQALIKEKEDVSQRLSEVQEKLHQETEGYFEQSAYAKSMAQQLQEEQQKVLRLRRAVDNMELDVQDLLSEKDSQISNLDATIRTLEHEKYMIKTRLVQVEDAIVDERHRFADLERHRRELEQELDNAKQAHEKNKFLETSKMESERSLLELRQRNDELMQEVQNLKMQITSLQQQASQGAANAAAMQTKISSMELASQLQVKHLESVSAQEASLRQELKIAQEEKARMEEKIEVWEGRFSLSQKETSAKESLIHELHHKVQALEEDNRALRKRATKSDEVEREKVAHLQQALDTLSAKNAETTRAHEVCNTDLNEIKQRLEARDNKYKSQRDLLARQSEVMRTLQQRCSNAESELRSAQADKSMMLGEVEQLQQEKNQCRAEMEELRAQVKLYRTKTAKGSELNSKLLGIMSQVLVADSELPSENLHQQLQGLNLSRSAAGS